MPIQLEAGGKGIKKIRQFLSARQLGLQNIKRGIFLPVCCKTLRIFLPVSIPFRTKCFQYWAHHTITFNLLATVIIDVVDHLNGIREGREKRHRRAIRQVSVHLHSSYSSVCSNFMVVWLSGVPYIPNYKAMIWSHWPVLMLLHTEG